MEGAAEPSAFSREWKRMTLVLGYGEFRTLELFGMFIATLPFILRQLFPALLLYAACTAIVESCRCRTVGVLAFLVTFVFLVLATDGFMVMGAYGPAHVGMECGFWAWPLLFVVVVTKCGIHTVADMRREWRVKRWRAQRKADRTAASNTAV